MWSPTMDCITKLSREISSLLRYATALGGNSFGTKYSPIFKGKKIQNREQNTNEVN
jgi:hypothetical protein